MINRLSTILPAVNKYYFSAEKLRTSHNKNKESSPILSAIESAHSFFDLNSDKRLEFLLTFSKTKHEHLKDFIQIVSKMIKNGIVGYEYLDVKNKPYKSFLTTRIGDQRLSGAKLYRKKIHYKTVAV